MTEILERLEVLGAEARWDGPVRLPDGHERFVVRYGEGPVKLVGQHGGPGADLRTLLPLVEVAGGEIEVILYDQLGGGRSDRPEDDSLWTVELFVEEFAALVAELELGKVHLLGQSWGGMLALECVLHHPDLVKSLILCDTMASTRSAVEGFKGLLAGVPEAAREGILAGHQYEPGDESEVGQALESLGATHGRRCTPFDLERSRREGIELGKAVFDSIGRTYAVMWGPSEYAPDGVLRDWDVSDRLGEIAAPTLVVCGLHDELTPESCHRPIVEGIADARWLILGQSSHAIFLEDELDVVLPVIREFVSRNGDSGD